MKRYAPHVVPRILLVLFTVLALFSLAAAPFQEAAPPDAQSPQMATLALALTAIVSYVVVEGLKAISAKYPQVPTLTGWGTRITAAVVGLAMIYAGRGLAYLPIELQTPTAEITAALLTLALPYVIYEWQKRFVAQSPGV